MLRFLRLGIRAQSGLSGLGSRSEEVPFRRAVGLASGGRGGCEGVGGFGPAGGDGEGFVRARMGMR